jgi:hypothetical protein
MYNTKSKLALGPSSHMLTTYQHKHQHTRTARHTDIQDNPIVFWPCHECRWYKAFWLLSRCGLSTATKSVSHPSLNTRGRVATWEMGHLCTIAVHWCSMYLCAVDWGGTRCHPVRWWYSTMPVQSFSGSVDWRTQTRQPFRNARIRRWCHAPESSIRVV